MEFMVQGLKLRASQSRDTVMRYRVWVFSIRGPHRNLGHTVVLKASNQLVTPPQMASSKVLLR